MSKKYLYCNGDSWTYGEEIGMEEIQLHINEKYYNTWPWFLSQELGIPVCINDAAGGGSNDRIYRRTYDFIKKYVRKGKDPKELMIVIGWTSSERNEIGISTSDLDVEFVKLTAHDVLNVSKNVTEETMKDIKIYRDSLLNLYTDNAGIQKQLTMMDNLRFLCDQLGIEYYDFIAIGYWPPMMIEKAKDLKIKLKNFYTQNTFNNEVISKNLDAFEGKHPTPETYKKWAKILKNFIEE